MMKTVHDIQRLCETWWKRLADATREEHVQSSEQFLIMHGWTGFAPVAIPMAPVVPNSLAYLVQEAPPGPVAAHFLPAGVLAPPRQAVDQGLDFCPATRSLVAASRLIRMPYAFMTDLCRFYLYDTRTEELLLHASTPAEYVREFGDVLFADNVAGGSLDEIRRQPRSYLARQFREWMQRWYDTLQEEWRVPEEMAWLLLDRLVVLRYLAEHRMLDRPGWRQAKTFLDVMTRAAGPNPEGAGRELIGLFRALAEAWQADLFTPDPAFDHAFASDRLVVPLLREFGLLCRSKFNTATVLESFNYGDASEKARVRMIPEENPEREAHLSKQTFDTVDGLCLELDLMDEGYRAIFHWLDKVVDVYARLAADFETAQHRQQDPDDGEQDLFDWSQAETSRPGAFSDPFAYGVDHGIRVYYASPRQRRTARLMLYMYLIRRYQETGVRFTHFPAVDGAMAPRPVTLETDRKCIYQQHAHEEWEVI